jgi:hypothetical protein
MLRRQFWESNVESLATDKAVFFGPFADLVVFKEFHCLCPVWLTDSVHQRALVIAPAAGIFPQFSRHVMFYAAARS